MICGDEMTKKKISTHDPYALICRSLICDARFKNHHAAKTLLELLLTFKNASHSSAWPSQTTLAKYLGTSRQAIQQHLKTLERLNCIKIYPPTEERASCTYEFTHPSIKTPPQAYLAPPASLELAPPASSGTCTNIQMKQTIENSYHENAFEEFWNAYPDDQSNGKRHTSKISTHKLWIKISKEKHEEMMIGLTAMKRSLEEKGDKAPWPCRATTFLKEEKWKEWLPKPKSEAQLRDEEENRQLMGM